MIKVTKNEISSTIPLPIKVKPYHHQTEAYKFICKQFGLSVGDKQEDSKLKQNLEHINQNI